MFLRFIVIFAPNWDFMVTFLKNIRRRKRIKALEGSHIQVFPKVEELERVALVWRVDAPEDALQLEEVVDLFHSAQLEAKIVVVEHGKAFKKKLARDEFSQLCEDKGVIFIPKAQLKWYGFLKVTRFSSCSRRLSMI